MTALIRNLPRFDGRFLARLPPLRSKGNLLTVVLARPKDWRDAAWAAYGALSFVYGDSRLLLLFDGKPSSDAEVLLKRLFPDSEVDDVRRIASEFASLHAWTAPFKHHKLVPKLLALLHLQQSEPLLYLDSDVFVFQEAGELANAIASGCQGVLLTDCGTWNQDNEIRVRARALGLRMFENANTGLLHIPRGSLDLNIPAKLCAPPFPEPHSLFVEQSTLAVLTAEADFKQLPPDRYVVDNSDILLWHRDLDYKNVIARHYTGTVRHRLRLKGIPLLRQKLAEKTKAG